MSWEIRTDRPIYLQLIEQMELKICSGVYALGSKLPPVRDLAQEASVNPNTMQKALAKLEEDGLLYTNRTIGRFVTEDVNIVNQVKNKLAKEQVQDFLKKMRKLGFDNNEVLSMLETMLEGVEQ
ncbi:MAG: GntR family transcriptional regulator [Clostridiaceae bacterium]|nr:GntR family transcriptional regulator [Clostridiaceae bacterium]